MRLLVFLTLAGCSFQGHAALPDAQRDAGTDGKIVDGAIDALDASTVTDTDGDGVADASDNCPMVANADQHDHDGDGRGDACDLCPHINEPVDTDSDGDGIGDACDPRPMTAGDVRKLFIGFYAQSDTQGWLGNTVWTVSNGVLTGGSTNVGLSYTYPTTQYQHAFVQTSVHLNQLAGATGSTSPAAILYNGDAGGTQYYACEAALEMMSAKTVDATAVYPGTSNVTPQPWTGTLAAGSDLMYTDSITGGTHTCTVSQGNTKVTASQTAGANTGVVSLATANANVAYDYLWIVEAGS